MSAIILTILAMKTSNPEHFFHTEKRNSEFDLIGFICVGYMHAITAQSYGKRVGSCEVL